jgi:uncharacterized protein YcbX
MRVVGLHVYPIKSAGGIAVEEATVEARGFRLDRRYMLVDEDGSFLTQRVLPHMALLGVTAKADHFGVTFAGAPEVGELEVPLALEGPRARVRIFGDTCDAIVAPEEISRWFSAALGVACRLVYMPDDSTRRPSPSYARADDLVSFADGFPFLLASVPSLADLNRRLDVPLPMNRFRPNIVVDGCRPFEEDEWRRVEVCGVGFRVVKPCGRCVITTVDQATAEKGVEPLRTLAAFRAMNGGVSFAQNLVADGTGTLKVGAELSVKDP